MAGGFAGVWLDWGPVRVRRIDVLVLSSNPGTLRVYSYVYISIYVLCTEYAGLYGNRILRRFWLIFELVESTWGISIQKTQGSRLRLVLHTSKAPCSPALMLHNIVCVEGLINTSQLIGPTDNTHDALLPCTECYIQSTLYCRYSFCSDARAHSKYALERNFFRARSK